MKYGYGVVAAVPKPKTMWTSIEFGLFSDACTHPKACTLCTIVAATINMHEPSSYIGLTTLPRAIGILLNSSVPVTSAEAKNTTELSLAKVQLPVKCLLLKECSCFEM